jgi:hypothetical protein
LKKPVSKADLRAKLDQETARFLRRGGSVDKIPQGISGKEPGEPPVFLNRRLFIEPKTSRTPVPEVVAAIEARRNEKRQRKTTATRRVRRPRRKVIYDDFGEPVRRVWIDD